MVGDVTACRAYNEAAGRGSSTLGVAVACAYRVMHRLDFKQASETVKAVDEELEALLRVVWGGAGATARSVLLPGQISLQAFRLQERPTAGSRWPTAAGRPAGGQSVAGRPHPRQRARGHRRGHQARRGH